MNTTQPTALETFRGQIAEIELADAVRSKARKAFDTGDPEQSALCITEHLDDQSFTQLSSADRFSCPRCGHLIKDRSLTEGRR